MNIEERQENNHIINREELIAEAQKLNLLSDVFMSAALNHKLACQHVIRILTGIDDLIVKEVRTQ